MKHMLIVIFTGLILTANAAAAIRVDRTLAQSMDDVHSLGVVYINHNSAENSIEDQLINQDINVISVTNDSMKLARQ